LNGIRLVLRQGEKAPLFKFIATQLPVIETKDGIREICLRKLMKARPIQRSYHYIPDLLWLKRTEGQALHEVTKNLKIPPECERVFKLLKRLLGVWSE